MKTLQVEFETLESGPGVLDLAIRYDVNEGKYEFAVEENGIPTTISTHEFVGILQMIVAHAQYRFFHGYGEDE